MTKQTSGPLGEELRQLLRLIEDVPAREPEPAREPTVIPTRSFERHRLRDDVNRRPAGERPAPPAPAVPPAPPASPPRVRLTTRSLSLAAAGIAGAVAISGWFILGQRTGVSNVVAGGERSASEPVTAVAQKGPPVRSASAPATHTPMPSPNPASPARPSLTVQPITTAPNERVRFLVRIEPISITDNAFLRVQGLPKQSTLSRGRFVQPDSWIVPAGDFAALELTLGDVAAGRFELVAELQMADGRSLAHVKSLLVVNARPTAVPANSPDFARPGGGNLSRESSPSASVPLNLSDIPDQGQDKFLAQGLRLLLAGSVNSARLLLQRAADAGDANAALILGDTYDEVRLSQLGVQGVMPDRDKANFWYGRADELGSAEAKDRLSEINSR